MEVPLGTWEELGSEHDKAGLSEQEKIVIFNEIYSFCRWEQWGSGTWRDTPKLHSSRSIIKPSSKKKKKRVFFLHSAASSPCFINDKLLLPMKQILTFVCGPYLPADLPYKAVFLNYSTIWNFRKSRWSSHLTSSLQLLFYFTMFISIITTMLL